MARKLCIDRRLLGTNQHLVVDAGFLWSDNVPSETWHLDGTLKCTDFCLDTALKLSDIVIDVVPPQQFLRIAQQLSGSLENTTVPWQKFMPAAAHVSFTKRLIDEATVAMEHAALDYYGGTWVIGNSVLEALQPVYVDQNMWRDLVTAGEGNVPAVRSFVPDSNGCAGRIKYDRFKTLTGRLTVESGPQILTLKREHRSMLRSRYGARGGIWALDFAALEARILLYEHGGKCDDIDLYGSLASELGYDRKAVKGAVISELYGGSKYVLGQQLGISGKELNDFVKKVKSHFRTDELLARVKKQFVATGKVINRYGRPVRIDDPLDNVMINYYAQSTGVDVTMMGFKQVIARLAIEAPKTCPVFLLHDAMLLDVHEDDLDAVRAIEHVKVKGYVQHYPFKLEKIA